MKNVTGSTQETNKVAVPSENKVQEQDDQGKSPSKSILKPICVAQEAEVTEVQVAPIVTTAVPVIVVQTQEVEGEGQTTNTAAKQEEQDETRKPEEEEKEKRTLTLTQREQVFQQNDPCWQKTTHKVEKCWDVSDQADALRSTYQRKFSPERKSRKDERVAGIPTRVDNFNPRKSSAGKRAKILPKRSYDIVSTK